MRFQRSKAMTSACRPSLRACCAGLAGHLITLPRITSRAHHAQRDHRILGANRRRGRVAPPIRAAKARGLRACCDCLFWDSTTDFPPLSSAVRTVTSSRDQWPRPTGRICKREDAEACTAHKPRLAHISSRQKGKQEVDRMRSQDTRQSRTFTPFPRAITHIRSLPPR